MTFIFPSCRGVGKKPYLAIDQLVDFLNNTQRDPRLNEILYPYYNTTRAQIIIETYEKNRDFVKKGIFTLKSLINVRSSHGCLYCLAMRWSLDQDMTVASVFSFSFIQLSLRLTSIFSHIEGIIRHLCVVSFSFSAPLSLSSRPNRLSYR